MKKGETEIKDKIKRRRKTRKGEVGERKATALERKGRKKKGKKLR